MPRNSVQAQQARAASVFAALGDPNRLRLVSRLGDGKSHSISNLADGFGLTRQGVTKHLRVLEDAGLVASEKAGRERAYVIDLASIRQARDYLARVAQQWDDALARLKDFVEEDCKP